MESAEHIMDRYKQIIHIRRLRGNAGDVSVDYPDKTVTGVKSRLLSSIGGVGGLGQ